jgi:suppressor of fused protein SUFU
MNPTEDVHRKLTALRVRAFSDLFGGEPEAVFPYHRFPYHPDDHFLIDVFVYPLGTPTGPAVVAVTNGMSDQRMVNSNHPRQWSRRELIQYLRICTEGHARRLRDMAWLPLFDGFLLDSHHSVAWSYPAVEGTPWRNGFFLEPIVRPHREFRFAVEGDEALLLWHVPISDEERAFKIEHGSSALLDRMDAVALPWVFDENNRPLLLG